MSRDRTLDGVVDEKDLYWMIQAYGETGGRFDINKDGLVDATDVSLLYDAMAQESKE